jgi:hypothetical protein
MENGNSSIFYQLGSEYECSSLFLEGSDKQSEKEGSLKTIAFKKIDHRLGPPYTLPSVLAGLVGRRYFFCRVLQSSGPNSTSVQVVSANL